MIKILQLLFFMCLCFNSAHSQSLYFKTGKNFANYVFKSSPSDLQSSVVTLQSDTGSFYQLGAAMPLKYSRFSYEFGISLNELNSIVQSPSKAVRYKTDYIGLDNSILFSIVKERSFSWDVELGLDIQTIVFGKQEIEGVLYDLKRFSEFNGLFFRQSFGTQFKLVASNQMSFCFGYDFYYDVLNTRNNSIQSLKINNDQIKFGIYYLFDKINKNNINDEVSSIRTPAPTIKPIN